MKKLIYIFSITLFLTSCFSDSKDLSYDGPYENMANESQAIEKGKFEQYLIKNKIEHKNIDDLIIQIEKEGKGQLVKSEDTVLVAFKVYFSESPKTIVKNSYVFDGTLPLPEYQYMKTLPKGLLQGLQKMKPGSKAKLFLPSWLAFGEFRNTYKIPKFATTVWEVELFAVGNDKSYKQYEDSLISRYFSSVDSLSLGGFEVEEDTTTSTNYYYKVLNPGTSFKDDKGRLIGKADTNNVCEVNYTGYYINGESFDSTYKDGLSKPMSLYLHQKGLLTGFQKAIAKLKRGGRIVVAMPSSLGYENKSKTIYNYNPILFHIELNNVEIRD